MAHPAGPGDGLITAAIGHSHGTGHGDDHSRGLPTAEGGLDPGWVAADAAVIVVLVAAAVAYAAARYASRHRSRWRPWRTLCWYAGLGAAGAALLGPVARAAHASFTAHMLGHLLLGMAAPLLLVLAAPVTLALRSLPVAAARRLSRLLRSPYVRVVTHPVVAGTLNAGGLWVLYAGPVYPLMHAWPAVHVLVHAHVLLAGYLFTASLVGPDPDPHRASMTVRSVVLVAFIAAHSVLAKWLYAHPPAGVAPEDGRAGAQLMYYGGDAVDVLLVVLLFSRWYAATRPDRTRRPGTTAAARPGG